MAACHQGDQSKSLNQCVTFHHSPEVAQHTFYQNCCRELLRYVRDLWRRGNPDDIQLLLLTLINAYLAEVPLLQNLRAQVRPSRMRLTPM